MIGSYKRAYEVGVIDRATGIGWLEAFHTLIVKGVGQFMNRSQRCTGCLADIDGVTYVVIMAVCENHMGASGRGIFNAALKGRRPGQKRIDQDDRVIELHPEG